MADTLVLLALSSLLLLCGHVVRALRWRLLLPNASGVQLLFAVCLGNLCNLFIPYRLGEFLRIFYVWKMTPNSLEQSVASVLIERTTDLLAIFLLCLGLVFFFSDLRDLAFGELAHGFLIGSAVVAAGIVIRSLQTVRRPVGWVAGLFNDRICVGILRCVWSFANNMTGPAVLSWRYLGLSVVMWGMYFLFYISLLPILPGHSFADVLAAFHGEPLRDAYQSLARLDRALPLLAVSILPLVAGIVYVLIKDRLAMARRFSRLLRRGTSTSDMEAVAGLNVFQRHDDYYAFLMSIFDVEQTPIERFYRQGLDKATIVKILLGGSGAVTAVIQDGEEIRIRKFVSGANHGKLRQQMEWLRQVHSLLPVAEVIRESGGKDWFSYDMPYLDTSANLYERAHLRGGDYGRRLLDRVLDTLEGYHARGSGGRADDQTVDAYIREKVIKNCHCIRDNMAGLIDLANFRINGEPYTIAEWDSLFEPASLRSRFCHRGTADIHGDLTLENIVTLSREADEWFLIDSNGGNIFDSPLLDWAKLFQSLHLGYEIVNKSVTGHIDDGDIRFLSPYTAVYADMHRHLRSRALDRFGEEGLREILLHEIVHYLRLIPYKFVLSGNHGALFFAQCCLLIRQYDETYGGGAPRND